MFAGREWSVVRVYGGSLASAAGEPLPGFVQRRGSVVAVCLTSNHLSLLIAGMTFVGDLRRTFASIDPAAAVREHPLILALAARAERNRQQHLVG